MDKDLYFAPPELDKGVVPGVDDVAVTAVDDGILVVIIVVVQVVAVLVALSVSG